MSGELAEELGLHWIPLYGMYGGDLGFCDVATGVRIQVFDQSGQFVDLVVPVMVVPRKKFCFFRQVVLSAGFLAQQGGVSLGAGPSGAWMLMQKGEEEEETRIELEMKLPLPPGVHVTGYFCCSKELSEISAGGKVLSSKHIFTYPNLMCAKTAELLNVGFDELLKKLHLCDSDRMELLRRGMDALDVEQAGFKTWPGGVMEVARLQVCCCSRFFQLQCEGRTRDKPPHRLLKSF